MNYGMKLDGVTPKQKPGRKPTKTPKVYVMPGFDATGNIVNATLIGRGRPGEDKLAYRRVVTLPIGEAYDFAKHGPGERDPADDAALDAFILARDARKEAQEAAKKTLADARQAAKVAASAPAAPVSTEVTVGAESDTVTV
jgi:hypothetical protein